MPHEPGHTNGTTPYKIYGTNEPYAGMTVEIGGILYSTVGGALEGDSMQLVVAENTTPSLDVDDVSPGTLNIADDTLPATPNNPNPVTRTFISRVLYYRQDGTTVPTGTEMHEHADGTIMLGHDPNNMGEIVTRTNPDAPAPVGTGMGGGNGTTPIPRSGGGGATGGGMGGGSY